ncbi:alpha/beta fold hydrolase [Leptolyngbya sp. FACHB-711]|uniref:alpha/beta fold hydrolase n=1 Tax=Leptolyngbya sp. FACHB-711 TaxID=2692813 RepID=UPI0016825D21|nr:alpha/beta fold hydrolase [Leptolyngbya sp. FACHB-711]MBD1852582.1 alpha/beta fold hydrolase [Cyanobacteria bacterium FACHB-502]MBD2024873.1 alpha/beta fold hydrolase [Leptolyngbya sp. FACHB-711]
MAIDYEVYELGNVQLQSGEILPDAKLAYATYGTLNAQKDNVIIFPTHYTGTHRSNAVLIGSGRALDPDRYFIIVPNLFGNGLSSSPSNILASNTLATNIPDGAAFPHVTLYDNIQCQFRLITEQFGIERIALVLGWSMGAQQAYHWAALYPDRVERIFPYCGSAKTSVHNRVFLEGVKAALTADATWQNGRYTEPPTAGLKAFGRVYAGWAYSQAFYREGLYRELGFETVEALLKWWEDDHLSWDANDLLAMLWTWQHGDISNNSLYKGDFALALRSIRAKAIVMPSATDLYFPPEDNAIEVAHMPSAELRIMQSIWGHCAGGPGYNAADTTLIEATIAELLA